MKSARSRRSALRRAVPALVGLRLALAGLLLAAAGCTADQAGPADPAEPGPAPVVVQPGAPGQPGRPVTPGAGADPVVPYTAADVFFAHQMVPHHQQALELTGLVPDRTGNQQVALLAQRIESSQADEIALLESWLVARGEQAGYGDHDHTGGGSMPGMLTDRQLAELAGATGREFDQLFLERMTYHHEGALAMVAELLANGGGQEAEIFQLASHIETDQRVEIDRMRRMLAELPAG